MEITYYNIKNAAILITIPAYTDILREQSQIFKEVELHYN